MWRRVLVPGGYTLDRVHRVFQHALGWQDCHLHSFEIDGRQYGEPDPDGELALRDELDTRLDAVVGKGDPVRYTYDFGDWWEHDVTVEDVFGADPDERYPGLCRTASGPVRRRILADRSATGACWPRSPIPPHPEHESMRAWAGPGLRPGGVRRGPGEHAGPSAVLNRSRARSSPSCPVRLGR